MTDQEKQIEKGYLENVEQFTEYDPLEAPVKHRDYTNIKVDSFEPLAELEEPVFNPPSFDDIEEEQGGNDFSGGQQEPNRVFNESYSELSGKEKTMGAEMMAQMALDMYTKGCSFLGKLPEISESNLDKLIADGEINPDISLQTAEGALPIKQFATAYNDNMKSAFEVSEEFKENITPPLIRIFKKRGIGMTDEQLVGYYLLTDLGTKGVQAVMIRKTTKDILDQLKQQTLVIKEQSAPKPKAQESVYTPPPTPTPPPTCQTSTPEYKQEEYTEDVSEVVVMNKPKSKKTGRPRKTSPLTNVEAQIKTFTEPEEDGVFVNFGEVKGFQHEYEEIEGMPQFVDTTETLSKIEQFSNEIQKPVRRKKSEK